MKWKKCGCKSSKPQCWAPYCNDSQNPCQGQKGIIKSYFAYVEGNLVLSLPLTSPVGSQVEEELLEQEFLERCFQEMLEEEDQDWFIPSRDLNNQGVGQLQQQLNGLSVSDHHSNLEEVAVSRRRTATQIDLSTSRH